MKCAHRENQSSHTCPGTRTPSHTGVGSLFAALPFTWNRPIMNEKGGAIVSWESNNNGKQVSSDTAEASKSELKCINNFKLQWNCLRNISNCIVERANAVFMNDEQTTGGRWMFVGETQCIQMGKRLPLYGIMDFIMQWLSFNYKLFWYLRVTLLRNREDARSWNMHIISLFILHINSKRCGAVTSGKRAT